MKRDLGILFALAVVALMPLSSCGGGGDGGGGETNLSLPSGISTSPAEGDTDVDLSPLITVTFPDDMDETTVTSSAFTLSGPKGAVAGDVTYDAATRTASFKPSTRLASTAAYTATLSTAVMTKGSSVLAADYSWTFTTRARKWGTAQLLETNDDKFIQDAKSAMNGRGDAVVAWRPFDGTNTYLWVNTYTLSGGWGTPVAVTDDANVAYEEVGIDGEGNAMVAWIVSSGDAASAVYARRYTPTDGWGDGVSVDTRDGYVQNLTFAMSESGHATVLWRHFGDIFANRYTPGTGWGTPQVIDETGMDTAKTPSVAMDAAGNAVAVWEQWGGSTAGESIWSKRYTVGEGWGEGETIDDATTVNNPRVAMSENGHVVAVWSQSSSLSDTAANRYVPGEGWTRPQVISRGSDDSNGYRVAINDDGDVAVIWTHFEGSDLLLYFNSFTAGGDWDSADYIGGGGVIVAMTPQIAADSYGDIMLARAQGDGTTFHDYVSNLSADGKWGEPQAIEAEGSVADVGGLSMNFAGDAAAVLIVYEGATQSVAVNLYQ